MQDSEIDNQKATHWASVAPVGAYWGMRFMMWLNNIIPRAIFILVLYPVVLFYYLLNTHGRAASHDFFTQLKSFHPQTNYRAGFFTGLRHFVAFADAMLDKLSTWSGKITVNDVVIHGKETFQESMSKQQGAVILGSHLGNLEITQALASLNNRAKLNVLVHTKHAENFNRLLQDVSGNNQVNLIEVTDLGPQMAIVLEQKIQQGEHICIVGDRVPINTERVSTASFLGKPAEFAQGPMILASLLKCPIYTLFCLKQNGQYHIYFDHFADSITLPRKTRAQALQKYIDEYAKILEHYCVKAPMQWFNFYFYWQSTANSLNNTENNQ